MTQPTVFISYSHEDEEEKKALVSHLGVLASEGLVDVWVDDDIGAGSDWQQEISQAIARAKVAILLITANFLTSDFILNQELPELLKRRQSEGLVVFPIIARACPWKRVSWLSKMRVRPKNGKPVWGDNRRDVDAILSDIAEEVMDIVTPPEKERRSASTALDEESQSFDLGAPFTKGLHIGEFSIRGCTVIVRNFSIAIGVFLLVFGIVATLFNNPNIRGLIIRPYETGIAVINPSASPTHTPTTVPTSTPTKTLTPTPTFTPTPTPTPTSTPSPVPTSITARVNTDSGMLRVREVPSRCPDTKILTLLENGTTVTILKRTPPEAPEFWLQIQMSDGQVGYVLEQYVDGDFDNLEYFDQEPKVCPPTPTPGSETSFPILENLSPNQEIEYLFFPKEALNTFVLMFRPDVTGVQFDVYEDGSEKRIGGGSRIERDGDITTGELIWDGRQLTSSSTLYHLRIVNNSPMVINYCLAREDVSKWTCPLN